MKVALIGVSGWVGSRLAAELLERGHTVTGIARNPGKVAPLLDGHDVVVSAVRFQTSDTNALIAAVKRSGAKRLLVAGGAGCLEVAPGKARG